MCVPQVRTWVLASRAPVVGFLRVPMIPWKMLNFLDDQQIVTRDFTDGQQQACECKL